MVYVNWHRGFFILWKLIHRILGWRSLRQEDAQVGNPKVNPEVPALKLDRCGNVNFGVSPKSRPCCFYGPSLKRNTKIDRPFCSKFKPWWNPYLWYMFLKHWTLTGVDKIKPFFINSFFFLFFFFFHFAVVSYVRLNYRKILNYMC